MALPYPQAPETATGMVKDPGMGGLTDQQIVDKLNSYKQEGEDNRKGGPDGRDDKWAQNLDLYWGRYDFSAKADWQAKEVLPEVSSYVDRFAAAVKEALVATPEGFYTVSDPADAENDVTQSIKRILDVWLENSGRNHNGAILPYHVGFEERVKLASIMASASVTTWKRDVPGGRVAIETLDPRNLWLDHTGRNLYRRRRIETDLHSLQEMAQSKDRKGRPLYKLPEIAQLLGAMEPGKQAEKEALTGHGHQESAERNVIELDEYIATILDADGKPINGGSALYVVANGRFLIRGPEGNPFWHNRDWITFTPLIPTPLSVYGRAYMEDFGDIAKTFIELTNMLLDAIHTTSLSSWAIVPEMLRDAGQVASGLKPNKLWLLEDGMDAKAFAAKLDLGQLPADAMRMWQAIKSELTEKAGVNEIGMGQFAPHSRTTKAEVQETQQNSSAIIRSVAQTIETRMLEPELDLAWKTGLQHMRFDDPVLRAAAGDQMYTALYHRRKELASRPITFRARGLSMLIERSRILRALLTIFQIVSGSEPLIKLFFEKVSPDKFINMLFELNNIDLKMFQTSERERMMQSVMDPLMQAQQNAQGAGPAGSGGQAEMSDLMGRLNLGGAIS